LGVLRPGSETQALATRLGRRLEARVELVREPTLAREEERGQAARARLGPHHHLVVGGDVEPEGLAVGHERLLLRALVVPQHAAGTLQPQLALLDEGAAKGSGAIGL